MKQKKIWICIACYALLVCCLAIFSTLGHKQGKTDSELSTRDESAGKSSEAEDVQKDTSGKKQSKDTGKKTEDAISKDSHEESKKDTSSEGSEDKNSQSKPETKQDSEGPVIEDNGDILLPEVP